MTALTITVGAGLERPRGRRLSFSTAGDLARILRAQPPEVEGWWSPHTWRGDTRSGDAWEAAAAVVLDIDTPGHAPLSPELAARLDEAARSGELPGSIFHRTPAGARLIFVFDEPCSDRAAFIRAAEGAARMTAEGLAALALPEIEVDPKPHVDVARLYFLPNCTAKGTPRRAEVFA